MRVRAVDAVTYIFLVVPAAMLAINGEAKQAGRMPEFMQGRLWAWTPIVLLSIALVLFIWKHWPWRGTKTPESVSVLQPGLPRLRAPSGEFHRSAQVALKKKAEEFARELLAFVAAQRLREPDMGERFAQMSSSLAEAVPFNPLPHALREYAVQFKDRVATIYAELGGGSDLAGRSSTGFQGMLDGLSGVPSDPTTFNEIVAIALELGLKASRLPSE